MSRRSPRRYGRFAALALALGMIPMAALVMERVAHRNAAPPVTKDGEATLTPPASRATAHFTPAASARAASRAVAGVRGAPVVATPRGAVVADELVVRPGPDAAATAQAIAQAGGRIVWSAPRTGLLLVRFASAADARVARGQLAGDGRIAGLFANRIMEGASLPATAAEARAAQWHLAALRVPSARSAAGVTVAVLDSGVAYESFSDASGSYAVAPDLAATSFAPGWDFIHDDAHPNDDHGHGTHVTALIAAGEPVPGVAPGATILPVKVLDAGNLGTELGLAEGLRYAVDHGADVINLSLSFQAGFFPSRYLQEAVDYAAAHGVVLVAAAGNQGGNAVSYPAAFREAIAVGASRVWDQYRSPASSPWQSVEQYLRRAEYSNRGFRLDVVAPGGGLDGDANLDGVVDTVVAQTIVGGQPARFQYRPWAGTSQAAAQVSGVVALMLAADPSLTAADIRAILGETAAPEAGGVVLSSLVGRGFLRADAAVAAAQAGIAPRPRFAAAVRVALIASGGGRRGRATVEILDGAGHPVPGAQVYGTFTGGAFAVQHGVTGADGTVTFVSPDLGTAPVVAFQVDAVSDRASGPTTVFDRPSGALHIDTCSLQLLAQYAEAAGISTAGEGEAAGSGLATSPAVANGAPDAAGSGLSTSPPAPGDGLSGSGLSTSPGPTPGPIDGVHGAGLATSPAETIYGEGFSTSPGDTEGGSVAEPGREAGDVPVGTVAPSALRLLGLRLPRLPDEEEFVMLGNFSWTGSLLPTAIAAEAAWFAVTFPDAAVAESFGQGFSTSPVRLDPGDSFSPPIAPLDGAACTDLSVDTFVPQRAAGGQPTVAPRCGTAPTCEAKRLTLQELTAWAVGSGMSTSPRTQPRLWDPSTGFTEAEFERAVQALGAWASFAAGNAASPVADYDLVLDASGLDVAPP